MVRATWAAAGKAAGPRCETAPTADQNAVRGQTHQSPVVALRSIGFLSRHALMKKWPSEAVVYAISTTAFEWPGHTHG